MGQRLGQIIWPGFTYSMPIPEHIVGPDGFSDKQFLSRASTELTRSLVPRRCHASGRWLWLTRAYCATYVITGPGDPCFWFRWYSQQEMLVLKLKGY
jgi:hypothetical protein